MTGAVIEGTRDRLCIGTSFIGLVSAYETPIVGRDVGGFAGASPRLSTPESSTLFARSGPAQVKTPASDLDEVGSVGSVLLRPVHLIGSPFWFTPDIDANCQMTVRCRPVDHVFVTSRGYSTVAAHGDGLTEVTLDLSALTGSYVRVAVRIADSKRAWSNPIDVARGS